MPEVPRILVVDDEPSLRRLIERYLTMHGFTVVTANDGEEALARIRESRPDLVITDVMMPNMDGWDLAQRLRNDADFLFVPIIYVTALGGSSDRVRGLRVGADDYLTKPFELEELLLRVQRLLARRDEIERGLRQNYRIIELADDRAFSGELSEITLPSALTLLEMERKTGLLLVHRRDPSATLRIYMKKGRALAARLDATAEPRNEAAIFDAFGWRNGRFEFAPLDLEIDAEIKMSTTGLIMEGARKLDELQR
ncbi:MAG TPA: response regulator [Nannocystaceae bacterium]|nr:response regulator [Nannocystaceae bacterium]